MGENLWSAVKVISREASEVSRAFAVPRQAVNHTLGGEIVQHCIEYYPQNIKYFPPAFSQKKVSTYR